MKLFSEPEIRFILGIPSNEHFEKYFYWYDRPVLRVSLLQAMPANDRLDFLQQTIKYAYNNGIDNILEVVKNTPVELEAKLFATLFQPYEIENIDTLSDGEIEVLSYIADEIIKGMINEKENKKNGKQ